MFNGIYNKSNPPSKQPVNFYYYLLFCVPSAPINPQNLSSVKTPVNLNKPLRYFSERKIKILDTPMSP